MTGRTLVFLGGLALLLACAGEEIRITNDDHRVRVSGPLTFDDSGTGVLPTVRVSEDGERWEVEILADRYEERRKRR